MLDVHGRLCLHREADQTQCQCNSRIRVFLLLLSPSSMPSPSSFAWFPNSGARCPSRSSSSSGRKSDGMLASFSSQSSKSRSEGVGLSGSLKAADAFPLRVSVKGEEVRESWRELSPDTTTGLLLRPLSSKLMSLESAGACERGLFVLSGMDSGI
jgi:hypothetical protein